MYVLVAVLLNNVLIIIGLMLFLLLIFAAIISYAEKEKRASIIFILLSISISVPFFAIALYQFPFHDVISILIITLVFAFIGLLVIPVKVSSNIVDVVPNGRIDERDIMFSRNKLQKGTKNYQYYYGINDSKQKFDDSIRNNSGLLSKNATKYHPAMFASAHASFFAVEAFNQKIDGEVSSTVVNYKPEDITLYIKNWTKKLGALNVGITQLFDYHKYSFRGREHNYGNKVNLAHKFAIAFTVEMDYHSLKTGPNAPSVMESAQQYLSAGAIAVQLADFIRRLGYPAKAHIDGNYEVVCALVAKDAGLGELGRMGLLMTPKLGPRVRIAVVTTDLPLIVDGRSFKPQVIDFCNGCKKCAEVCPSNAISFDNRKNINGVVRWQINQESCFNFWTITGTDCGRCVSACPYSHPDNLLHNVVRFGIGNSVVFSKMALHMDNVIYGRKPKPKEPENWMKMNNPS